MTAPRVSVVMPTFEQDAFIARAVRSLVRQSFTKWELLVVDDGSEDSTQEVLAPFLADERIRYRRLRSNLGLGAAINTGLDAARAPFIAYLPSDDMYDAGHLSSLVRALASTGGALAWAGVRYGGKSELGAPRGYPLQLVQVLHLRTSDRWTERGEFETDDLEALFWRQLRSRGPFVATGLVSCEWVQHPGQRHRSMRESLDGGLNAFRRRYRIATPLRFRSSDGSFVDEVALYERFRRPAPHRGANGSLRILLVGELGYHPERIVALEERGHRLYGLWIDDPLGSQTVGPLPFGNVEDLPRTGWREAVRRIRPDVVYALLNWRAVPLANEVLTAGLGVPLVWHFKEAPMRCIQRGTWQQLVALQTRSAAQVYATPLEREWFELALPGSLDPSRSRVIDGDLVKADWLSESRGRRLSEDDGEVHTVVLGRPLGLNADLVRTLAASRIHLHLHGLLRAPGPGGEWRRWLEDSMRAAPGYVHVHPHVDQRSWVRELSRYDAAWLHPFTSTNGGDLLRATWDDLNYPARVSALIAAGLPLLQQESPASRVAMQDLVRERGVGVLFRDTEALCEQLHDARAMEAKRDAVWAQRDDFTFDAHADALIELFHTVIA